MLVETKVGRLFVEVQGEGPDLLLWHSLLCDGGMWKGVVTRLRESHRCIVVDAPGHGRSGPIRRAFSLDECVDAAIAVAEATGAARPAFAGLSWGGMVAMRLALRDPARLRALVLVDTSARAEIAEKKLKYRLLLGIARTLGPIDLLMPQVERLFFSDRYRREHPEVVLGFRRGVQTMDRESLVQTVTAVALERDDVVADLPRIRIPTLVLCGTADRATPPLQSELIARLIPGARLVRIPGAGHLAAVEQPDRVSAEVARFLADPPG